MFLAIPLENKPSWRSPPWMTVLIIVINCIIFWGWQAPEEKVVGSAGQRYAQTVLPGIELPPFLAYLKEQANEGKARFERETVKAAETLYQHKAYAQLYALMWQEKKFRQRLLDGQVITAKHARYAQWREARASFTPTEPGTSFTERWSMNYDSRAGWQPLQAFTSIFLHGSVGHLLGNMVFLFLFGFTLELALGSFTYLAFYVIGGIGASLFALLFYAGMGGYGLGASGAISALMAMYAVMYRMRRIRFFYMLLFYFNYATWPALVMLPVWMGVELLQHLIGGKQVAYMAHFGGLLTGALLMWIYMRLQAVEAPVNPEDKARADAKPLADAVARAQRYTDALDFGRAAPAWREAARLAPNDPVILKAWFESSRHHPGSDDFHAAARRIFKLPALTEAERQLQLSSYLTYRQRAKPAMRMSTDTMHALVRSFVRAGALPEAEKLCQTLSKQADHPQWQGTLLQLVNGLKQGGRLQEAKVWLPALQQAAPLEPLTQWLAQQPDPL
ncbi:rhomboid family intramembrane serine protease [Comamonas testosteroni]|uniref:Rhomboid family intramembrane serine protease n=1 Tax=Comamonas testosteroni TaxID=285 RepID=A0A373FKZ5_COMTE|nr:rhomboid family intramembrane serine protease [Comamonas testosteroni]RGE44813.1 rhomboid family intramembrane serine protease [Comamonas testosteroni]